MIRAPRTRCALVTGAGCRLGAALAEALAADGYSLHLHANHSVDEVQRLSERLQTEYRGSCKVHLADFGDLANVASLVDSLRSASEPPALIVNSASVFSDTDDLPSGVDGIRLERYLRVNAVAPMMLANCFLPDGTGHLINILDGRLGKYDVTRFYYGLSKELLSVGTTYMARALAPRIRVNAVAPGLILPPQDRDDAYLDHRAANAPLRTRGYPEDVARAVLYLDRSPFVTGDTLFVDGGEHL